jgi:hypothetical protein
MCACIALSVPDVLFDSITFVASSRDLKQLVVAVAVAVHAREVRVNNRLLR